MESLSGTIIHLDEVLTMSARMAAATGDPRWENRYRHFEPQLDSAIHEAIELAYRHFGTEAAERTNDANIKLVAMENRAFDLVHKGESGAAMSVLFSEEYDEQKAIYSAGINQVVAEIRDHIEAHLRTHRAQAVYAAWATSATLPVLLICWLAVVRMVRRYVADREQAEEALRRAHGGLEIKVAERTAELAASFALWQDTFDAIKDPVFVLDLDRRILKANKAMHETFPGREVIGARCYELIHGTDAPPAHCPMEGACRTGEVTRSEFQEPNLGGRWFDLGVYPIRSENGAIKQTGHMLRDITERRQAQEGQKKLTHDLGERVKELTGLYGVSRLIETADSPTDEVLRKAVELIPPSWRYPEITCARIAFEGGEFATSNFQETAWKQSTDILASGQKFGRVEVCYLEEKPEADEGPFLQDERNFIEVGARQLGGFIGRKRAEEQIQRHSSELERLNTRLEESNQELQEFTYAVSHDLQEPLRKIHTFADFLVEDCSEHIPAEGKEHLRRMQSATVRMKELIHHLLNLSRVDTRGATLVPTDPDDVAAGVLDTMEQHIKECGAEVHVQSPMPHVTCDPTQLGQVFQNLIGNALKFQPPGQRPEINVAAREEGDRVVFSVADNGIGIEERFLDKIFAVFQRLHTRDEYEGTGIGLTMCRKIIQRHGGRIWVESEPGRGSTFQFTLSAAQPGKELYDDGGRTCKAVGCAVGRG